MTGRDRTTQTRRKKRKVATGEPSGLWVWGIVARRKMKMSKVKLSTVRRWLVYRNHVRRGPDQILDTHVEEQICLSYNTPKGARETFEIEGVNEI